jgi:hypothetical protein
VDIVQVRIVRRTESGAQGLLMARAACGPAYNMGADGRDLSE